MAEVSALLSGVLLLYIAARYLEHRMKARWYMQRWIRLLHVRDYRNAAELAKRAELEGIDVIEEASR